MSKRSWRLKYLLEWFIAFFAIAILIPLFILIVLLEKLQDLGDIFYVSNRIGRDGMIFKLLKFRGMRMDAKPIVTNDLKFVTVKNDTRITPLGKILRLGFDELAQLFNILKGDMCIIVLRPNLPWEKELYNKRESKRLLVKPGITGLSQVLDGRSLHIRDNYELDARYVESSTFITDLKILICTLPYSFGYKTLSQRLLKEFTYSLPCQRTLDDLEGKIEKQFTKDNIYL